MVLRRVLKALAVLVIAAPFALAALLLAARTASVAVVAPNGFIALALIFLAPVALGIVLWRFAFLIKTAR